MKVEHLKVLPVVLLSWLMILGTTSPVLAATTTKPYFKASGADIMAGGWFDDQSSCLSNYQDSSYRTATYGPFDQTGGILAFAIDNGSNNSAGGASSQFAAMAMGIIERDNRPGGSPTRNWGLYSSGALPSTVSALSFANDNQTASSWGGQFDGSNRQNNCIPDYFSKKNDLKPTAEPNVLPINAYASAGGIFEVSNPGLPYSLTAGAFSVPAGQTVVFVDGPVYIGSNITYSSNNADSLPKFALVVRGSIYIDPAVTQLEGLYIAQPEEGVVSASGAYKDNGDIWTCHHQDPSHDTDFTDFARECRSPLTINGALIAKQVNLTRLNGDVGGADVAEVINFTPAMIVGGGFFNKPGGTGGDLNIDSLTSLPPVY